MDSYDIGDASLKINHVFGLTKTHARGAEQQLGRPGPACRG